MPLQLLLFFFFNNLRQRKYVGDSLISHAYQPSVTTQHWSVKRKSELTGFRNSYHEIAMLYKRYTNSKVGQSSFNG